jgi:hypothetical protein
MGLAVAASALAAVGFSVVLAILFPLVASVHVGGLVLACVGIVQSMMRSRGMRNPRRRSPEELARAGPSRAADLQRRRLVQTFAHPYELVPGAQPHAAFEVAQVHRKGMVRAIWRQTVVYERS